MRLIVDIMGGDNAPKAILEGCIEAIEEEKGFDIIAIGQKKLINEIIAEKKYINSRLSIINADEKINNDDVPTKAIKEKKESSMVKGLNLLKNGGGDAFISAGNSGALLAGCLLIVGRLKGVIRPCLGAVLPGKDKNVLLVDAGLNSSCKDDSYLQFAKFGSIYMQLLYDIDRPTVGLVNMGSEEDKGTLELKKAFGVLKSCKNLNFIGNIEGHDIILSKVDVAVTNGYTGNVVLKFLEGAGAMFTSFLRNTYSSNVFKKISALPIKKDLNEFRDSMDPDIVGGAPILGIKKLVLKTHGASSAKAVKNVIIKAHKLCKAGLIDKLADNILEG